MRALNRRAYLAKLDHLLADWTAGAPGLTIERTDRGASLHLVVRWSGWHDVPELQRSEIVTEALAELQPEEAARLTSARGALPS